MVKIKQSQIQTMIRRKKDKAKVEEEWQNWRRQSLEH